MPRLFDAGQYVTTPWHPPGDDLTITVWANWQSGAGPLVKTEDEAWAFPYDHDGACAFRVGAEGQVTSMPVSDVRDRWAFYALAVGAEGAALWIDDGQVDVWNSAPAKPQKADLVLMQDAIGLAAHFAVFERRLSDDDLRRHWETGRDDPDLLK
jgi:hypothetical protein